MNQAEQTYINDQLSNAQNIEAVEGCKPVNKAEIKKILMSEQAILGAVLNGAKEGKDALLSEVFKTVKEQDFSIEDHRVIYKVMNSIYQDRKAPDSALVFQTLRLLGHGSPVLGEYVFKLNSQASSQVDENFSSHLELIRNAGVLKELAAVGKKIEKLSKLEPSSDVAYLESQKLLKELPRQIKSETAHTSEHLEDFITVLDKRFNDKEPSMWLTGNKEIDEAMLIEEGNVIVLAGRPSMGKTTLALNWALKWVQSGVPTQIISMEMSEQEVMESLIACSGRVNIGNIKRGTIRQEEWSGINKGVMTLNESPLYINGQTRFNAITLREAIEEAVREFSVKAVVVDYIQLVESINPKGMREAEISNISRELRLTAKELGIVIVVLSQLNRALEARPNKRPVMSDLRESGAIEQDASKIVFIYRDEIYNPDSEEKGTAEIIGAKNRGGAPFNVRLSTELEYAQFNDFNFNSFKDSY